ncbi:MAG: 2-oxoglutarate dehydrogenase E1 component [Aeromonas sp.]
MDSGNSSGRQRVSASASEISFASVAYVDGLYQRYCHDPASVTPAWQAYFAHAVLAPADELTALSVADRESAQALRVQGLVAAFRQHGHLLATLDPLQLNNPADAALQARLTPAFYQLGDEALGAWPADLAHLAPKAPSVAALCTHLACCYCHTVGVELSPSWQAERAHEAQWLAERIEGARVAPTPSQQRTWYAELAAADGLERFLAAKFPGAKRFSLEGGDALIPLLHELLRGAISHGCQEAVIGMAHRGRLNVLVNVLGKAVGELCHEFAGKAVQLPLLEERQDGTGDVKYHQGYSADFASEQGRLHLALAFNPSHLEIVNPVVMGSVRARQTRRQAVAGGSVLPITVHGDAAMAGQGVVAETFNLSQTRGYGVGGSIRIVINNQVGFTTADPRDSRSSRYCTDIAHSIGAPVLHVNGDDVEAVVWAARLALDYRQQFKRDIVLELVCYRRHGHNEADEPSATQPLMYQAIKAHPPLLALYGEQLARARVQSPEQAQLCQQAYRAALEDGSRVSPAWRPMSVPVVNWQPYREQTWQAPYPPAPPLAELQALAGTIASVPSALHLQAQVAKIYQSRQQMARAERPLDWGMAENLAYASLLSQGVPVRLSGQDAGRGTFFHRHAVLHDQTSGATHLPLAALANADTPLTVIDSALSEEAVLAFEYGYASTDPKTLTLWEAQFGDFANGAQVVIDQFLSSGEQKWGRLCGLTLLLPHGYEGQGPEHSSARIERYLQLCAQHNMQVCMPSTPAQIFHLLRRQALRPVRRPLVVITPKSLLRHPAASSQWLELAQGHFAPVLGAKVAAASAVTRVVLCAGKVFYDLQEAQQQLPAVGAAAIALVRLEQLYPFPEEALAQELDRYSALTEVIWCQEEPQNQGAWYSCRHRFEALLAVFAQPLRLRYVGRAASASPATGSIKQHSAEQHALVQAALADAPQRAPVRRPARAASSSAKLS